MDVLFDFAISPSRSLGNLSCKVLGKDKDFVEEYTPMPGAGPELTLLPGSSLAQIEEEGSLLRSKSYLGLGRLEVRQQSLLCNNNYFNILGGAQ